METNAIVSVVIPTYNRKNMLKEAIESVLAQNYKHIEVIISDNASDDGTDILIQQYLNDARIKYIRRQENIGPEKNGLSAYKMVTGKYFMFLCDDDYLISPTFFSHAVSIMEKNPEIALVRGLNQLEYVQENKIIIEGVATQRLIKGIDFFLNYETEGFEHITGFFALSRKSMVDESKCLEYRQPGHDRWMWRTLPLFGDVYFLPEVIGSYRIHSVNCDSSSINFGSQFKNLPDTVRSIFNLALKRFPDRKEEILSRNPEHEIIAVFWAHIDALQKNYDKNDIVSLLENSTIKTTDPVIYAKMIESYHPKNNIYPWLKKIINKILGLFNLRVVKK